MHCYSLNKKYPILSYPEIIRVVLPKEVAKEKAKAKRYDDSEPTVAEIMQATADAFMVNDKNS